MSGKPGNDRIPFVSKWPVLARPSVAGFARPVTATNKETRRRGKSMIDTRANLHHASKRRLGRLFLNDREVGVVSVRGHDGSWGFGEFTPAPGFVEFAPVFGRWSLLMHADEVDEKLSEAASQELRDTEREMDAIRALLRLENPDESHSIRELNIDGPLIEWRE
jgi:hypothetical protein